MKSRLPPPPKLEPPKLEEPPPRAPPRKSDPPLTKTKIQLLIVEQMTDTLIYVKIYSANYRQRQFSTRKGPTLERNQVWNVEMSAYYLQAGNVK